MEPTIANACEEQHLRPHILQQAASGEGNVRCEEIANREESDIVDIGNPKTISVPDISRGIENERTYQYKTYKENSVKILGSAPQKHRSELKNCFYGSPFPISISKAEQSFTTQPTTISNVKKMKLPMSCSHHDQDPPVSQDASPECAQCVAKGDMCQLDNVLSFDGANQPITQSQQVTLPAASIKSGQADNNYRLATRNSATQCRQLSPLIAASIQPTELENLHRFGTLQPAAHCRQSTPPATPEILCQAGHVYRLGTRYSPVESEQLAIQPRQVRADKLVKNIQKETALITSVQPNRPTERLPTTAFTSGLLTSNDLCVCGDCPRCGYVSVTAPFVSPNDLPESASTQLRLPVEDLFAAEVYRKYPLRRRFEIPDNQALWLSFINPTDRRIKVCCRAHNCQLMMKGPIFREETLAYGGSLRLSFIAGEMVAQTAKGLTRFLNHLQSYYQESFVLLKFVPDYSSER